MNDKEAIEILRRIDIKFFLCGIIEQNNYIIDEADKVNNAIETVLNLLENQKAEIEEKDKSLKLHTKLEYQYKNDYLNVIEDLEKKDKIIDLMAEWIEKHTKYYDEDGCYCEVEKDICNKNIECDNCIKQYFEYKVEEDK